MSAGDGAHGSDPGGPRRVVRYAVTDSTNERALQALAEGSARHLDWHVADAQSRGRGRRGAAWRSAPGEGLYATLVVAPEAADPPRPEALTMAAGLGVLDAVRALGLAQGRLKWPNDLLVGAAKLAGILVEARGLDPRRPRFVVGVGLNVRQRCFDPALEAERAVTSLAREGLERTLEEAFAAVAPRLERRLALVLAGGEALAALARDYAHETGLVGRRVELGAGGERSRGRLESLDLDRGVRLVAEDGGTFHVPLAHVSRIILADEADGRIGSGLR